jgi:aspartyl-tRNA(Asn)/glutamyl-tRNA(Gln) amidotransferase subunit C
MGLVRAQVEKVALLARLKFRADELDQFTAQLGQILSYVEQLGELNTEDVEPLSHPLELRSVFRDDELAQSLPREVALANAPQHDGEFFLVPPVLD